MHDWDAGSSGPAGAVALRERCNPASPGGLEPLQCSAAQEMEAYDGLPEAMRRALREGPWNLSAVDVAEKVRRLGTHLTHHLVREVMQAGAEEVR